MRRSWVTQENSAARSWFVSRFELRARGPARPGGRAPARTPPAAPPPPAARVRRRERPGALRSDRPSARPNDTLPTEARGPRPGRVRDRSRPTNGLCDHGRAHRPPWPNLGTQAARTDRAAPTAKSIQDADRAAPRRGASSRDSRAARILLPLQARVPARRRAARPGVPRPRRHRGARARQRRPRRAPHEGVLRCGEEEGEPAERRPPRPSPREARPRRRRAPPPRR